MLSEATAELFESTLQRWALREMIRGAQCDRGLLVYLPANRWVPETARPRTEMGLPAPTRNLTRKAMLKLEDAGYLERAWKRPDDFGDPRRLTVEGWRRAWELLPKKEREKALPERPPLEV